MAVHDMTTGNTFSHLVQYSIPLILGNLFQLTYNVVDSVIAGRFIGREALAAEGMASPIMNIIILGISGICMGAGVIMSEFFGAGDVEKLKREMATTLMIGIFLSIFIIIPGFLFMMPLLQVLNVPEEVRKITSVYLRIILLGAPFTYLYNALAVSLKSVGDSKTPLYFLIVSSVLNGALDLLLIGYFGLGIACSAATTVFAQAVSSLFCLVYIYRKVPVLGLNRRKFQPDFSMLKQTLRYGSVTALQQSCQPIAKLLIQSCVNTLGVNVIAAYNAVTRVDDFAYTPEQSIAHSITTYAAQNRGAHRPDRIKEGFRKGLLLEFIYGILICVTVLLLNKPIVSLFISGENADTIISSGSEYLTTMAFFYILPAFTNGIQGYFRGMGRMKVTLLATFIQSSLLTLFTWILVPEYGIRGICFACAIGWTCMLLYEAPYYFYCHKRN